MSTPLLPFSPPDLFQLKFIQSAILSPDGATAVFSAISMDLEKNQEFARLWLVDVCTGETRPLTARLARDTNPQWAPDSKRIAFLSNRSGTQQIYIIPVNGGEAFPLTSLKQGAGGGPLWSPDGQQIAFTASPFGEPPDFKKPYRLSREIYRFDGMGYVDPVLEDIFVISASGGDPVQITNEDALCSLLSWSPDGTRILYGAAFKKGSFQIDPALKITDLNGDSYSLPQEWGEVDTAEWLPDGEKLVVMASAPGSRIGTKADLWIVPARKTKAAQPECRTADLPMGVGGGLQGDMPISIIRTPRILVSPDGRSAVVQVQDGGCIHPYLVALNGPQACECLLGGDRTAIPLDQKEESLLFLGSGTNHPMDLFTCTGDGSGERQLTWLNEELISTRLLPSTEHLRFPSTDGTQVEGWILKPPTGQPPYPAVLYIHGGPHSGFGSIFSFDFQMLAGAGFAVLFVNQRGSKGYDNDFATRIIGDWGNLDYADLMAGVDAAIDSGLVDPDRMGVCGLSGGGNLSCWIVGHTHRFKAAVPENPVTNWFSFYGVSDIGPWFASHELGGHPHEIPEIYRRCSPITYAHNCTTPTLLIQGESDYRCPAEQSEQFFTVLKANGCVVEMLRLPGSPHGGSLEGTPATRKAQNEALLGWMDRFVLRNLHREGS